MVSEVRVLANQLAAGSVHFEMEVSLQLRSQSIVFRVQRENEICSCDD